MREFFKHVQWVDLTHELSPEVPTWNGSCGFCHEIKKDYDKMFRVQKLAMHAGVGTHMDAPSHRFQGAASIADLAVENFIAPLCLLDVRKRAHADYEISVEDVEAYEQAHGPIEPGSLVVGFTGWSRFWKEPKAYRNADAQGQMHFPAFSKEAAALLLLRNPVGIGIDTLSPDCLNQDYPVHACFLGAGKYIIENVADCSGLPAQGAYAIALPLRAQGITECPIRLLGVMSSCTC